MRPSNPARPRGGDRDGYRNGTRMDVVKKGVSAKANGLSRRARTVVRAVGGVRRADPSDPVAAPFEMATPLPPELPRREVSITAYGADDGAADDCTAAINAAIDDCAATGGGRVVVPPGEWLTGPIHLRSNIDLHLSPGATLTFCDEPDRYLPVVFIRWNGQECYGYSPLIYARDCDNVAVTGRGTIRGSGRAWWRWMKAEEQAATRLYRMVLDQTPVDQRTFGTDRPSLRPQMIVAINCRNVLLEDFTVAEAGPFWTIQAVYCEGVLARRLVVRTPDAPNANGIVIDSSRDVLIEDCQIEAGDDCISLKSGMNEDGWRIGRPTENVVIRRVRATGGHGGLAIGSEMSGGIRNVLVQDCRWEGLRAGLRLKAARGRGGVVEHVYVRDVGMDRIEGDAIQMNTEYSTFVSPDGRPPTFRDIDIRNVNCGSAGTAVRIIGQADCAVQDVRLENVTIASDEGLQCTAGSGISLVNVRITPRSGPVLAVKDSQDVLIAGLNGAASHNVFLDLRGRRTRNICLRGEASAGLRPTIVLGVDVPRDSIVQE